MPTAVAVQSVQVSNNSKAQAVAKAQAIALQGYENQSKFVVDGVLFDMVSSDILWGRDTPLARTIADYTVGRDIDRLYRCC